MNWKLVLLSVAILATATVTPGKTFFPPTVDDPPLIEPKAKRKAHHLDHYRGVVAAVGPTWVELAVGWKGEDSAREKWMEQNRKPKRLSAEGTKLAGNANGEGEPY